MRSCISQLAVYLLVISFQYYGIQSIKLGSSATSFNTSYMGTILDKENVSICGAVIIGDNFILTAATCIFDKNTLNAQTGLKFVAGIKDLKSINVTRDAIDLGAFLITPDFKWPTPYAMDTATDNFIVMKLKKNLEINRDKGIDVVNFAPFDMSMCDTAMAFGFGFQNTGPVIYQDGLLDVNGGRDNKLKYFEARINKSSEYPKLIQAQSITQKGGLCKYDLGGPLVCNGYLIGLASDHTAGCNESKQGGFYTNMQYWAQYIAESIDNLSQWRNV